MDPAGYNQQVAEFQKALPSLGIHYQGRTDGIVDSSFISAMLALEMKLEMNSGIPAIGLIFSGGRVVMPPSRVLSLYLHKDPSKEAPGSTSKGPLKDPSDASPQPLDLSIQAWQKALSSSLPLLGAVYQGPIDGEMNPQLQSAAQLLERTIQARLKTKSVIGKIFDSSGKRFLTDPNDVVDALKQLSK
jgi:hypothetical protein